MHAASARPGLVVAILLALAPVAQAQVFGSQVAFGDNDFVPTYDALVAPDARHLVYVERGEPGAGDDAVYLDVDGDRSGVVEAGDVRLVPVGNRSAGTFVAAGDDEVGAPTATPPAVGLLHSDRDGNGRYTAGDAVYLVGAPDADRLHGTTGAAAWTLRLTPTAGGAAGRLVLDGDADLGDAVSAFEVDGGLDGGTPAMPEASFGVLDADRDLDPGLRALTPGDRLYLELDATGGATAPGDPVSLHSIRLVGDDGTFGTQVLLGHYDFAPRLDAAALQVIRYEGGTAEPGDDLLAIDVDGDGGGLEAGDILLSPGGGRNAGDLVHEGDGLSGLGTGGIRGTDLDVLYADVDDNGRYNPGDFVYLVGDRGGYVSNTLLEATRPGEDASFALRLTATSGGAAGTLVVGGSQDLVDHGGDGNVSGALADQLAFFDADGDGAFGPGDRAYLNARGSVLALHALRLHGGPGGFGAPVVLGDDDLVPHLLVENIIRIVRHNAGDAASFEDDVIVLDADGDGSAIEAGDLYLTGAARGTFVASGDGNVGKGNSDGTVGLVFVDVDGGGRYGHGDWAYLREKDPAGNLVATVTGGAFTLRLTNSVGGEAGTFVREDDVDLKEWNTGSRSLHALTDVGILDADGDRRVSPGDRVYLTEGLGWVDLNALRLVGDFQTRAAPVATAPGTPSDPGSPGGGDPQDPGAGDPGPSDPDGTPASGGDEGMPGPAAAAVLAALGLAAWTRRR